MFIAHSTSASWIMYSTLLELEQAMNEYLATHFPQFCDCSMSELLEIREGLAGGGMGVWVREGGERGQRGKCLSGKHKGSQSVRLGVRSEALQVCMPQMQPDAPVPSARRRPSGSESA